MMCLNVPYRGLGSRRLGHQPAVVVPVPVLVLVLVPVTDGHRRATTAAAAACWDAVGNCCTAWVGTLGSDSYAPLLIVPAASMVRHSIGRMEAWRKRFCPSVEY